MDDVKETGHEHPNGYRKLDLTGTDLRITSEGNRPGRRYVYRDREVLIMADDVPLIEDRIKDEGLELCSNLSQTATGGAPKGAPSSRVLRFRVSGTESLADDDIPDLVDRLRLPVVLPGAEHAERAPRVAPNSGAFFGWHGEGGPAGPPNAAGKMPSLPHRGWPPLAGHGVTVAVLDSGMVSSVDRWFDGRHSSRAIDEDAPQGQPPGAPPAQFGHGIFISSIVLRHAPGARVLVRRVDNHHGVFADTDLAEAIDSLSSEQFDILNLSICAYVHDGTGFYATADAIGRLLEQRPGVAVVAAAGNDNVDVRTFPAALKSVFGVAAIECSAAGDSKALFSNFGDWVDACSPGVDLQGVFPNWAPKFERESATWSGTSFAAPSFAGAVAAKLSPAGWRHYLWFLRPRSAREAAVRLIAYPGATRLPGLGTVVKPKDYC